MNEMYEEGDLKRMACGTEDEQQKVMQYCYTLIERYLRKYCDLKDEYFSVVTLWVMGTYIHNNLISYPYLFFNAMKGSGKSRLLRLISSLSHSGKYIGSPSESVLFRTAKGNTMCIDEFEGVGSKDKNALRELLNAAYKKGMTVPRMKKITTKGQEQYVQEDFEMFCPVAMANIWGMEEVLADRCISLILEKSDNPLITRRIENEGFNHEFEGIISVVSAVLGENLLKNIYREWDDYLELKLIPTTTTTYTTLTSDTHIPPYTQNTDNTLSSQTALYTFFERIYETDIIGRNLELFFPLLFISYMIGEEVFTNSLVIIKNMVKIKKEEDITESHDVLLYDFISRLPYTNLDSINVSSITRDFKQFVGLDEEWISPKWFGRALKRLSLIISKTRHGDGIIVQINIDKAKEMIKMFKTVDKDATPEEFFIKGTRKSSEVFINMNKTEQFGEIMGVLKELEKEHPNGVSEELWLKELEKLKVSEYEFRRKWMTHILSDTYQVRTGVYKSL